jgi:hypothetical protein
LDDIFRKFETNQRIKKTIFLAANPYIFIFNIPTLLKRDKLKRAEDSEIKAISSRIFVDYFTIKFLTQLNQFKQVYQVTLPYF